MIALYRGRSPLSALIRAFHRSDYSHAAWLDPDDGSVVEAWGFGGVTRRPSLSSRHTPGTEVDLFYVPTETTKHTASVRAFLDSCLGARYDYLSVVRFVTRRPQSQSSRDKWFCSELVAEAYARAGLPLLNRVPSWNIFPGMLAYSPLLLYCCTLQTEKGQTCGHRTHEVHHA